MVFNNTGYWRFIEVRMQNDQNKIKSSKMNEDTAQTQESSPTYLSNMHTTGHILVNNGTKIPHSVTGGVGA